MQAILVQICLLRKAAVVLLRIQLTAHKPAACAPSAFSGVDSSRF